MIPQDVFFHNFYGIRNKLFNLQTFGRKPYFNYITKFYTMPNKDNKTK